jgi:hypothetical protein
MALEHGNEEGLTKEEVTQSPLPHISSCFVSPLDRWIAGTGSGAGAAVHCLLLVLVV